MTDVVMERCNGYLVTYAKGGLRQWDLRDSLDEAEGAYCYPPVGWQSIGISPCRDGVPFATLPLPRIQIVTRDVAAE
jgi:hypothetical protein